MNEEKLLPFIYIVVPCFNEEEILKTSAATLAVITEELKAEKLARDCRILFVDDGSRDSTWQQIKELTEGTGPFCGLRLSHNCGHQKALLAGLQEAAPKCDVVVTIDADLQDDPAAILEMAKAFDNGAEIVYGLRADRSCDSSFKRGSARLFYRLMLLLGAEIKPNHADFRLMSRRAVDYLLEFHEANLFLRGLVPLIGLKNTEVQYTRRERKAGQSKYPLTKMLALAFDGLTSFSVRPIRLITATGLIIFLISVIMLLWSLYAKFFGQTVKGWTSLMLSIWMLGGIQLLSLGLVGEYIGKIYKEAKGRPGWFIWERRMK